MPITTKIVKGVKYLYFSYYDQNEGKKKEQYCGQADDPVAQEKAKELERIYLQNRSDMFSEQVDIIQNQLKALDDTRGKVAKRKPVSRTSMNGNSIYALEAFKNMKIYEPEIYYKSSEHMREVKSNSVQLIVTSPPYNVGKEYGAYNDSKDFDEYMAMLERVWKECMRILCTGGRIAINVADIGRQPYLPLHAQITKQVNDLGFLMRGVIYWDKGASVGISTAWGSWRSASNPTLRDVGEYVLVFCKDSFKLESPNHTSTINSLEFTEYSKSLWSNIPAANADKEGHPAPFPDKLPERLIKFYTFLGDTVLDPFLGSG
ncbi:MAG: DNA-methyltransferase, partial [Nitrososphaera sp.]